MPVDLSVLPEKLSLPRPPRHGRWCLVVLVCSLVGASLVVLLWPEDRWRMSLWFWCCALVLPLMLGLVLYALRLLAYERRCEYVESWNHSHDEQEQVLIERGQRAMALLATSYCSAAGNNQVAQALRYGSKPLQPIYLESQALTMRLSQLTPPAQLHTKEEYAQRLGAFFQQVMRGLDPELQRYARNMPLRVRIRHNQVLSDDEVLSLWHSSGGGEQLVDQVAFAIQDDGLLWLDAWLDEPRTCQLLLSLEVNLFLSPVAEQAESVSAVLLAHPDWCVKQGFAPMALVHRPVQVADQTDALSDALLWGRLQAGDTHFFTWQTQLPSEFLCDVNVAMSSAGHPLDTARCQRLDDSFGLPGCAVGNVALIVASEQARADRQAQLVMLQDTSLQVCVVQPV